MTSTGTLPTASGPAALSRVRLGIVYLLLAIIVGGHLVMIVFKGEHWPFSRYPMYSVIRRDLVYEQAKLFGIRADQPGEVEVEFRPGFLPLSDLVIRTGLDRVLQVGDQPRVEQMLRDALALYEYRRAGGRHDGPPLKGIRLYEIKYIGDPRKRTSMAPDERRLLCEFMEPA